jgi:YD repeat-containing protein
MFSSCWITCIALLLAATSAQATRYVYDDAGRVIGVVNQTGQASRYEYDAVGNLIAVAASTANATAFALQPDHGPPGTQVRVIGNALPTSPGQQILFSGATSAPLLAATAQEIQFTVPAVTIGAHVLTLEDSGNTLPLGDFEVTTGLGPPTIASVSHSCAKFDSVVSLTGSNFDIRPNATRVEVGGRLARVTAITETALSFRAPLHTPGGPVRVTTEAGTAQSSSMLYLVTTAGDPCLGMVTGNELQIDGGIVNVQLSPGAAVAEFVFFAERDQTLTFQFSNPTVSIPNYSFNMRAGIINPEMRKHPVIDSAGNRMESQSLGTSNMSVHLLPIQRTGYHVMKLEMPATGTHGVDIRLTSVPKVTKGDIATLSAAPGQWVRLHYLGQPGDRIGLGLQAQNTTSDNVNHTLYPYSTDHVRQTWEVGSDPGCTESTTCALNVKTLTAVGEYPFSWFPGTSASASQATVWINDNQRDELLPNVPQPISITRPGQDAWFPVVAEAGGGMSFHIRNLSFSGASGAMRFRLYAPDGSLVPTKTHGGSPGTFNAPGAMVLAFQLPLSGTYFAVLDPSAGYLANGEIELDPGLPIVVDGPALSVASSGPSREMRFTIDGVSGQKLGLGLRNLSLVPSSTSYSQTVYVYLPNGEMLGGTWLAMCYHQSPSYPGCELDLGILPVSGRYVVVVQRSSGLTSASYEILATSDVELGLTDTAEPVEILRQGGNARLYFEGTPGSAKTIHISTQVANPSGAQVAYSVLRPDGFPLVAPLYADATLTGSASGAIRMGDFPLAGTYTVFVDPRYAGTASFNARVSDGVLDNAQIPVLQTVVPGPWFWSTLEAVAGTHPSIGVQIQSLTNPSGTLKIEVVDPLNRRLIDYDAAVNPPYTSCTTYNQYYCDFDFMDVWTPGTHQIVVWPGTPRREDAQLTVTPVTDLEVTGRDVTFSTLSAGQNARVNFDAQSGEALKLVLTRQASSNPTTDIWVYAFDPSGNRIGKTTLWNGSSMLTWNLPGPTVTGTYSIVLDTRYGTPFSLRAQMLPQ